MKLDENVKSVLKDGIWAQVDQAKGETLEHALEYYEKMERLFKTLDRESKKVPSASSQPENISFDSKTDQPQSAPSGPSIDTGAGPLPETPYWSEVAKMGLGCAGTVYFAYKAYHAIGRLRKKEKEEEEKKYPSWLPALGYTVAAVCSAAYTVFKLRNFC